MSTAAMQGWCFQEASLLSRCWLKDTSTATSALTGPGLFGKGERKRKRRDVWIPLCLSLCVCTLEQGRQEPVLFWSICVGWIMPF